MKLHLPLSLHRSLRCCCSYLGPTAEAMVQHADVSIKTYTDFGQNMGRYSTGNVNLSDSILSEGLVTQGQGVIFNLNHGF